MYQQVKYDYAAE